MSGLTYVAAELVPESCKEFHDIISWQRCDVTFPLSSHQQVLFLESVSFIIHGVSKAKQRATLL